MALHEQGLLELKQGIEKGDFSAKEVAQAFFARIKDQDKNVHAFLHVNDAAVSNIPAKGAFAGLPVGVKDNFCTKGIPTTAGATILKGYQPPYSATAVERLEGAVLLGKQNMDEFAMGVSTEFSAFGPTKNPWDLERIPGGSSGGSAAAVAARMCPVALGTDTGGSIRGPAGFCGVVGFKPSYGAISRYGVIAMCSSLDTVGVFANTVEDVAYTFDVLKGQDGFDTTVVEAPAGNALSELSNTDLKDVRVGVPREYFEVEGLDPQVKASVQTALENMKKAGATIMDVSLPHTELAIPVYYIIVPCEVSSNLARFDGIRYGQPANNASDIHEAYKFARAQGFGPESKRRIMIGTYALSSGYIEAYYVQATKVRSLIVEDFNKVFEQVDVLVTPTNPTTAFEIGEKSDPLSLYSMDIYTAPASLAGVPAISVPCGLDKEKLPIGLQFIGPQYQDAELLRIANAYLHQNPFKETPPK